MTSRVIRFREYRLASLTKRAHVLLDIWGGDMHGAIIVSWGLWRPVVLKLDSLRLTHQPDYSASASLLLINIKAAGSPVLT